MTTIQAPFDNSERMRIYLNSLAFI